MTADTGGHDEPVRGEAPDSAALRAIEGLVKTFARNDVDGFIAHLTADVVLEPPPFLMGKRHFEGHDGVRAGFAELDRLMGTDKQLRVWPRRYWLDRTDPDTLLVLVAITVSQPDSPEFGAEAALLLTMRGEKVAEYHTPAGVEDGLVQLGDPFEVEP